MTTTLRPRGPEEHGEDGSRARSYEICVNSRPVGRLRLTTDPRFGPAVGRLAELAVDEGERHRGRGAVAALAAEEVLRQWGCRRAEATVPATATAARHLVLALGYRERGRQLLKTPTQPPALPGGSAARPMTEAEFAEWRRGTLAHFTEVLSEEGIPWEQAQERAEETFRTLLPAGASTEGAVLRVLTHDNVQVGTLWLKPAGFAQAATAVGDAYVHDVHVGRDFRGRGHGRSLMLLADGVSLAAGARTIGLSVFAGNVPALRLYESLGYRPAEYSFYKSLD